MPSLDGFRGKQDGLARVPPNEILGPDGEPAGVGDLLLGRCVTPKDKEDRGKDGNDRHQQSSIANGGPSGEFSSLNALSEICDGPDTLRLSAGCR